MPPQGVHVRREPVSFPTYEPQPAEKHPMFLEKRVYQGSSGKVYPLPFFQRISDHPTTRAWEALYLENDFLELMILPELGGRIHAGRDKINGYDFFYRQNVIKPALVGLAGPWISGGVEFNWPQHHRPATFMPVDVAIEEAADGSKTVWLSDHDPMSRMKGMHGVCLYPDKALIEIKVRAYNRTPFVQTFLWWVNVGVRVHEGYQSFFPPDVTHVADHAKRAISTYPHCTGTYYGVDYAERAQKGVPTKEIPARFVPPHSSDPAAPPVIPAYAPNDLSWYANIPVPTSYMCIGSNQDFFGGYDHFEQAGLVHVADHHMAPGKKQWTWGNHDFGYAWDRNLSDDHGPYIELMAGVFTDNQPDFSFLQPGETKSWSQFWYPIRRIGPVQAATPRAAVSLRQTNNQAEIGVFVTESFPAATVEVRSLDRLTAAWTADLSPEQPFIRTLKFKHSPKDRLKIVVRSREKQEIISYQSPPSKKRATPPNATEPALPQAMESVDDLYLAGLHLEQYRHATRSPVPYWLEALRRDAGDSRCHNALGLWHLRRGEYATATSHFHQATARLTGRNPNPGDGEAFYNLGLALRYLNRDNDAYPAFYKATWNMAWQAASFHALAEIDGTRGHWTLAREHLDRSLRVNSNNLRARNLRTIMLGKLGEKVETLLHSNLQVDPLDWWARYLLGEKISCDLQTCLDLTLDFAKAGLFVEAIQLLEGTDLQAPAKATPAVAYYLGWLYQQKNQPKEALHWYRAAAQRSPDYWFPARLEEIAILESAMKLNPGDGRAPYHLGNLLYDKGRQEEATRLWELSTRLDPAFSIAWRNLGIATFNARHQPARARSAYEKAFRVDPFDSRILYERDQLWKRMRLSPRNRLRELEKHRSLVEERDDLSIELCSLYNQTRQPSSSSKIIGSRKFQPWEGGEGLALGQHVRTQVNLARIALKKNDEAMAGKHLEMALFPPANLGEARHLLANCSDLYYYLAQVQSAQGNETLARQNWELAATFRGDFQEMSVRTFSEMSYYSALAMKKLGHKAKAQKLLQELLAYARALEKSEAKIDFFATSLPAMLLFADDIQLRQKIQALFLQAQAHLGLGRKKTAENLLITVLRLEPSHGPAFDLRNSLYSESIF